MQIFIWDFRIKSIYSKSWGDRNGLTPTTLSIQRIALNQSLPEVSQTSHTFFTKTKYLITFTKIRDKQIFDSNKLPGIYIKHSFPLSSINWSKALFRLIVWPHFQKIKFPVILVKDETQFKWYLVIEKQTIVFSLLQDHLPKNSNTFLNHYLMD